MMDAHDARFLEEASYLRTITIPTLGVHSVDFEITPERREELYQSGRTAAAEFFERWSPQPYSQNYQEVKLAQLRETV